jgi:hypothetical protein
MADSPVHPASSGSPNKASKPDGVTPSTAAARYAPGEPTPGVLKTPAAVAATSMSLPSPAYAVAQPGSPACPAPMATPRHPPASQSTQLAPTPFSNTLVASSPPAPQPGAVPSPSYAEARRASIPPPPKADEIPKPAAYYASHHEGILMSTSTQASSPKPSLPPLATHQAQGTLVASARSQPPSAVTSTGTPTSMTQDLSHPPGYVQDSRASFSERPPEPVSPMSQKQSGHSRARSRNGILDGGGGGHDDVEKEDKGLWDTAVSWAKTVGEKVIEGEEEMWKRIKGQR